jgi:hypothetical protein
VDWFSVHLATRAPESPVSEAELDVAGDRLMDLLAGHDGVVSAGGGAWSATISVQADQARSAADAGGALIEDRAAEAGLPGWPVVRLEALRQDVLDAENERPTLPALVSAPEVAEILGVSAQRVHELAAASPRFPEAAYELRTGKLWLRDAVVAFGRRRERKPGRPRSVAASSR